MAWGDWVRTYAGAVRRGAAAIAGSVIAAGGSVGAAAQQLRDLFGRLPAGVANLIAGNVGRNIAGQRRQFYANGNSPLPDSLHAPKPDLPKQFRYQVVVKYASGRNAGKVAGSVIVESSDALSWYELTAKARTSINVVSRDRRSKSEMYRMPDRAPELEFELAKAWKRSA